MSTETLRAALSLLVDVLSDRHYGRMPERVQIAYDAARAALAQPSAERDALRADAERWRNIRDHMDTLVKERDFLRAELDRLYGRTSALLKPPG